MPIKNLIFCKAFLLALLTAAQGATGHSWYPNDCCSGEDCKPADVVLRDRFGDFRVWAGKDLIDVPRSFPVRASPDGRPHICYREEPDIRIIIPLCLFLPTES